MTDWQDRIIEFGRKPAHEFLAHPENVRRHPNRQRDALRGSMDSIGNIGVIIENVNTGHVIDGHLRIEEALSVNETMELAYVLVDLAPHEEAQALASYDFITYLAEYDRENLDSLLRQVQSDDERVQALLSDLAEQNELYFGEQPTPPEDPGAQIDRAEELNETWQVQRGDLWIIPSTTGNGEHRLLCGDSTNEDDVARVMGGELCNLVVTDPPYGVSYADKNKYLNAIAPSNRIQVPIENDHLSKEDMQAMWKQAFSCMSDVMCAGAVVYCFMPQGGDQMMMMMMMMGAGIEPRHELIWLKNNHVLGRVDYAYKHEPILYAWKDGGHKFYGDFQTSVIECNKPQKSDLHPTTKPVELLSRLITNSSKQDNIVYDPFGGSGTTMAACEQLQRQCRMIEIEPKYCSVILERMKGMGCDPYKAETPALTGA